MRYLILAVAVAVASPTLAAQPAAPVANAVDSARLAAAKRTMQLIWPDGTFKKVMDGSLDAMIDNVAAANLKVPAGSAAAKPTDPHHEERFRITMDVMMDEIGSVMTEQEPAIRDAMALAYARRFSVAELDDMNRFFATPTGRKYIAESYTIMRDPDFAKVMTDFNPRLIAMMPQIMKKVEAATAHLPPLEPAATKDSSSD